MFTRLAIESLKLRKVSVILTIVAMTISLVVLLAVERISSESKQSFANTISGVDLVVGGKTSQLNLLLYSVFRIGNATSNISWQTYQDYQRHRFVSWSVPISLGDSHKGYRVVGTTNDYFKYIGYGNKRSLSFAQGDAFKHTYDVVLGSEVARALNYKIGDRLVLAHGIASFSLHSDKPFKVSGILNATGTPVDRSLLVSLEGIEAIHQPHSHTHELEPEQITAFMVGLKSKLAIFNLQRAINQNTREPLLAILPGVALTELWQMMAVFEKTLKAISALVLVAALFGLSAMLTSSIRERREEVRLLRVIGAPRWYLFALIQLEALLIATISIALSLILLLLGLNTIEPYLSAQMGMQLSIQVLSPQALVLLGWIILATVVASCLPGWALIRSAGNRP